MRNRFDRDFDRDTEYGRDERGWDERQAQGGGWDERYGQSRSNLPERSWNREQQRTSGHDQDRDHAVTTQRGYGGERTFDQGRFAGSDRGFDRDYNRDFRGDYNREYRGDYNRSFGGDYNRSFGGDYNRDYRGDYNRSFGSDYNRSFGDNRSFSGDYNRDYRGDYNRSLRGDYNREYRGDYNRSFGGDYNRDFRGDYNRSFGGDYNRDFPGHYLGRNEGRGWGREQDRGEGHEFVRTVRDAGRSAMQNVSGALNTLGERVRSAFGRGPKGYKRSDDRIREDVCEMLSDRDDIDVSEVTVRVQNGEVTLEGTVDERHHRRLIEQLAENVRGVEDVHNQIRVKRPSETTTTTTGSTATTGATASTGAQHGAPRPMANDVAHR
ncbi:BON domain-containing protein [Sorangium sp. So ce1335]|uniref:BON domain-containing protein n=1 Tax=Sorangium sp. So ce1335 TaxID=3133335 RepID=UPI003F60191F